MDHDPATPAAPPRFDAVRLLVGLMLLAAVALVVVAPPARQPLLGGHTGIVELVALVAMFAAAEILSVHLHFSHNSHSFSLYEIPLTLGLFFAPPVALLAAHLVGSGAALAGHRRQRGRKLAFNLASFVVTDVVAITIFERLPTGPAGVDVRATAVTTAATLAASLTSALLVVVVIGLAEHRWRDPRMVTTTAFGAATALASTSLGLIAVIVIASAPQVWWLLLVPASGLYLANHSYASERRRDRGLELLHDSTRIVTGAIELNHAVAQLVSQARETFRASYGRLVYAPPHGSQPIVAELDTAGDSALAAGDRVVVTPCAPSLLTSLLEVFDGLAEPKLVRADRCSSAARRLLDVHQLFDAVIAPLQRDGRACGVLILANRAADVTRFERADVAVLGTFAASVTSALDNDRLEQSLDELKTLEKRLTYQATHDALTELPNRALLIDRLRAALDGQRGGGSHVAVLYIDLDGFKAVNDTFGHAAGDALLVALSRRLVDAIPSGSLAARLGGDEFAVLLPPGESEDTAAAIADELATKLVATMSNDGTLVEVGASVGVAVARAGERAEALLAHADAAMYVEKGRVHARAAARRGEITSTPEVDRRLPSAT